MMLTFDPETHIYRLDGEVMPSVTQVLQEAGLIDASWFTEYARTRGTAVHAACHYCDEGDLDESTLDAVILPYLEGWRKFKEWLKEPFFDIEKPLVDTTWRYAGTPDRVTSCQIVDLKTGQESDTWGIQLAAYQNMVDPTFKRLTVRLDDQGNFYPKEWTSRDDWKIFKASLTICHWKRRNSNAALR